MVLFRPEDRERVEVALVARANADPRVVAAAVVGSAAEGTVDQYSDLDLTFGIQNGVPVDAVLAHWTDALREEMEGADLFDLPAGRTIYRVFLLPGNLQVDLSFSPETEFGATGPHFRLLFGEAVEMPWTRQPDPRELLGLGVHHALRARFGIERERFWQAEYWLSETRHHALALACLGKGLGAWHGRTLDRLPAALRNRFEETLVASVEPEELLRALKAAIGLLREVGNGAGVLSQDVDKRLALLMSA